MQYQVKELPKGEVEISFDVPLEEVRHDLEHAAAHLTEHKPVPGFRAGKTPYDVVAARYGEMAIYEEALPSIVRHAYVKAIQETKLRAYGQPEIGLKSLVPGNPVAFTATVGVLPKVEKMPDIRAIKVAAKEVKVDDSKVDGALKEIQKMQTKEVPVDRPLGEKDKAVVDMDLLRDGVPVEGGQARGHGIYLDEEYYIPGLKEKIVGQKAGETRTFTLKFPDEHFQKHLAGKDIDFKVMLNEVQELQHPDIDDEFAKKLGKESIQELRDLIAENMRLEMEDKERQRREIEALDQIVEKARLGDIPEVAVNDEINKMLGEMEEGVTHRGMKFADYLQSLGKTLAQLKLDFAPQAVKRIKTSLVIDAIGEAEKIEVPDGEVVAEIEKASNAYAGDPEAQKHVRSEEYEEHVRWRLRNRHVLELIREVTTK